MRRRLSVFYNTLLALLVLASAGSTRAEPASAPQRIVSLGGTITEIVFALGAGDRLVGVDASSTYPAPAAALPHLDYYRQISAEAVLSLRPTLVLLSDEAGPASALEQLRAASVRIEPIDSAPGPRAARQRIQRIAGLLGRPAEGKALLARLAADETRLKTLVADATTTPSVLFLYARGAGMTMVAGRATEADAMIRLAGARNAITAFDGYKPLGPEALLAADPDAILMMEGGLKSLGGPAAVKAMPGLGRTRAARAGRIIAFDDLYLLGFGPRYAQAAIALARALHPEFKAPLQEPKP